MREADERWRNLGSAKIRRLEDERAAALLKVNLFRLGEIDAALTLDQSNDGFFVSALDDLFEDHFQEGRHHQVVNKLMPLLADSDYLVVPLGLGNHLDHQIAHRVATTFSAIDTLYYEDFPYALELNVNRENLVSDSVDVPWEPWRKSALVYRTQVRTMFSSPAKFEVALATFAAYDVDRNRAGSRIWYPLNTLIE